MDDSTRIIVVRHGQTISNSEHKFDGQQDTPLSLLGRKQIDELSKKLKTIKFDLIVSSPLSRARNTANAIAKGQNYEKSVDIEASFMEIDCGDCTGLSRREIEQKYSDLVNEWQLNTDPRFPGGENMEDVEKRAIKSFINIAENNKGKTILITGHGTLNRAIIGYLLQIPYGLRFNITQKNCAVNEIIYKDINKFKIEVLNG